MFLSALDPANTGIQAASTYLDTISNNVANSTTPGYKTAQVTFQDLLYTGLEPSLLTNGKTSPGPSQLGVGAAVAAISGVFTQGAVNPTGNQFDIAINGQGFFPVNLGSGSIGYTRAGNFTLNSNGQLVTSEGFTLAGGITVPQNASSVNIAADGTVTAVTPNGTQNLGQIQITQFQNPGGLTRIGNTTFAPSSASGATTTGTPGSNGLGTLQQGNLEQSNVDLPSQLINLVIAQQAFTYNTQSLQVENQVLQDTATLIQ